MKERNPKLAGNYRKMRETQGPDTAKTRYNKAVDEYKALLEDKTHPQNRTEAHRKNKMSILNRLMVAADELDAESPGSGIFGLIALCFSSSLALKDKNIELEARLRSLELKMKRLEKK